MRGDSFRYGSIFILCTFRLTVLATDLKPGNILLRPSDVGNIVMHELFEDPARLYGFPKTVPPDKLLFYPVTSAPLVYDLNPAQVAGLHWVIADLGHGALARRLTMGQTIEDGCSASSPPRKSPEQNSATICSSCT